MGNDASRLREIDAELRELPGRPPTGSMVKGFHSEFVSSPSTPTAVTLDMYAVRQIDTVVLVPAVGEIDGRYVAGYGFPKEYRIEGSVDGSTWETFIDVKAGDAQPTSNGPAPLRRPLPIVHEIPPGKGLRKLRIRPTQLAERASGLWVFALSEVLAFEGETNRALYSGVTAESALSTSWWAPYRICDGRTSLGLALDKTQQAESIGFHSAMSPKPRNSSWLQVDLGRSRDVYQVNLIPAKIPSGTRSDSRFPVEFRVELSEEPDFVGDGVGRAPPNRRLMRTPQPGDNIVPTRTGDWPRRRGRYVRVYINEYARVEETETPSPAGKPHYAFALSEIEVLENSPNTPNVAVGSVVSTNIQAMDGPAWELNALTDGFASQGKRIPLRTYIDTLLHQHELEQERLLISTRLDETEQSVRRAVILGLGVVVTTMVLFAFFLVWRVRSQTRQRLGRLRRQIARDLHDDIGSSLASIRIMSDLLADDPDLSEQSQQDVAEINRAASKAGDAMRDIVWLIDLEMASTRQLIIHLRTMATQLLTECNVKIKDEQLWSVDQLPIEVRRSIVMAFKETLNNVRRHASASSVDIDFSLKPRAFSFTVRDDGVGFDPSEVPDSTIPELAQNSAGTDPKSPPPIRHGLKNLRLRAKERNGRARIESWPGRGTTVEWEIRL